MYQGYKIQIYPNNSQIKTMENYFNAHIFAYNWALEQQYNALNNNEKLLNKTELKKFFNTLIKSSPKYEWLTSKYTPVHLFYYSFNDVNQVMHAYLTKTAQFKHHRGKPKFKSRDNIYKTFCQRNDMKLFFHSKVQIAKLGKINANSHDIEYVGFIGKPNNLASIRFIKKGSDYYVTFNKKIEEPRLKRTSGVSIGIDLGMKVWATSSIGVNLDFPEKSFNKYEKKLKLINRKIEKRRKSDSRSNEYNKLVIQRRKYYKRLSDLSTSCIKQYVAKLLKTPNLYRIVMETLSMSSMKKSNWFDSKVDFLQFRYFRDEMEYQCKHKGILFVLADNKFPSSQICSDCGFKQKMPVSERTYNCPNCGVSIDRDYNASLNLSNYKK